MPTLFNITHETGDLSEYDSTVTDGGDLSVHVDAALAGSGYGLKCLIDDTNAIYGQKNVSAPASGQIRYRYYVDPNALTMANGNIFWNCQCDLSGSPWALVRSGLYKTAAGYFVRAAAWDDAGWIGNNDTQISDAPHYVEVHIERASSAVASDGRVRVWVDGVLENTWSSVDNYDAFALLDHFLLGAASGIDAGTSGTFYLDELRANDDGIEIGPVTPRAGGTAARVLIGDRFGRVIAEVSPAIGPVAWRLNEITRTTLTFAKSDPKTTADNLRYGNRVLIQFDDDLGLPGWGGTMEPPLDWKTSEIGVTVYSIEYLLQFRTTDRTRSFNSAPVGRIFRRILQEAEEQQPLGLTFGPIWMGGGAHYPRYHFKNLWWILHDSLRKIENCDFRFVPRLIDGYIRFQAELYEKLGEDKAGWCLKEGKNVSEARVTEQGPIINEFAAAGAGTTWGPDRAVSIAREENSNRLYGLRQDSKVFAGVTEGTTLDRHAVTEATIDSYPHVRIGMEVANVAPAAFRRYEVGDVVRCVLPSYGFDGYDESVRVLAREYRPGSGKCTLVVEEERSTTVAYEGPGSERTEE